MDQVKKWIQTEFQKPGNVFLGLIHRLDRNVSGVVLFARTSKGASRLSKQFREKTTQKIYRAIVEGKPNPKTNNTFSPSAERKISQVHSFSTIRKRYATRRIRI